MQAYRGDTSIRGFTLVEVLVALFVLAVGVVGASAAQLAAARTRQQSALAAEAAQLGAALAARMQANPAFAGVPDAANPYLALDYEASDGPPGAPPASCFGASDCAPAALAQFDLHAVRQRVHDAFPGGRVLVCRDDAPWDEAARRYRWSCSGSADAPILIKLGWSGTGDAPAHVGMLAP